MSQTQTYCVCLLHVGLQVLHTLNVAEGYRLGEQRNILQVCWPCQLPLAPSHLRPPPVDGVPALGELQHQHAQGMGMALTADHDWLPAAAATQMGCWAHLGHVPALTHFIEWRCCVLLLQILSNNTRRTKVVELSTGTHRYSRSRILCKAWQAGRQQCLPWRWLHPSAP